MRLLRGGQCRRLTASTVLVASLVMFYLVVVARTLLESGLRLEGSSSSSPSPGVAVVPVPHEFLSSSASSSLRPFLQEEANSSFGLEDGSAAPASTRDDGGSTDAVATEEQVGYGHYERQQLLNHSLHQPLRERQKQRMVDLGSCGYFRPRGKGEQREVEGYVRMVSAGGRGEGDGYGSAGSLGVLTLRISNSSSVSFEEEEDKGSVFHVDKQHRRIDDPSVSTQGGREHSHRCISFDSVERFVVFFATARSGHSWIASILDASPDAMIANEFDALRFYEEQEASNARRIASSDQTGLTGTQPCIECAGSRYGGQGGAGDPNNTSQANGEDGIFVESSDFPPLSGGSGSEVSTNCTLRAELYGRLVTNSFICGRRGRVQYYNYTIPGLWQGRVAPVVVTENTTAFRHSGGSGSSSLPVLRIIGDKKGDKTVKRLLRRLPPGYYHHTMAAGDGGNGTDDNATRNNATAVASAQRFFQGFLDVVGDDPRLIIVLRHPFNVIVTAILRHDSRRSGGGDVDGHHHQPSNDYFRMKKIGRILDTFLFLSWAPQNLGPSPTNWRVVRMEDFARDVDREVRKLCDFVGASCPDALLQGASERTSRSPNQSWRLVNWTKGEVDLINEFVRVHLSAYYDPIDVLEEGDDEMGASVGHRLSL